MKSSLFHLHATSSLHVGIGQGVGVIDLPIARERASHLPQIPGSGIKGVLRDMQRLKCPAEAAAEEEKSSYNDYLTLYGPEAGEKASEHAGALAVGDAHLLALPVRSWKGIFAWTTCPMILGRYARSLQAIAPQPDSVALTVPELEPDADKALHADDTKLTEGDGIYLEDLDLKATTGAQEWAEFIAEEIFEEEEWKTFFTQRFLIIPDNLFSFLSETATEIRARIKIDAGTRTVKNGALWYEEYLPAETLLWGILAVDRSRKPNHPKTAAELLKLIPPELRLQLGGNATVGGGQARWIRGD